MSQSEILDLVSDDDVVVGTETRDKVYQQRLSCFRVVNAFIINKQGQLWIPRRHPDKKLFPLALDASVGGHVRSGEKYEQAFIRETAEEVGIDLSQNEPVVLARLTPHSHGTSAFMYVYGIYQDVEPSYNRSDIIEAFWFYPSELLARIEQGEKAKSDLPIIVRNVSDRLKNI